METRSRTIIKSLTWRVVALVITTTVVWVATRKMELAASVGLADTAIKLVVYYAHERCWLKVHFGKLRPPDYQI
ncbi:MAG TPA: DUF2061 domain-containing protein [Phycisphaerae bacterium]|uniref:DUF2061 domain-containing protein n=1 Tax=marine sediment metagenome TaxID=412755 RepID=A0A0F9QTK2_9ZZZZ|nr:DUF2061 domain-containing protein [Phycisphaerae bacterium]